jgi:hypothetical protein
VSALCTLNKATYKLCLGEYTVCLLLRVNFHIGTRKINLTRKQILRSDNYKMRTSFLKGRVSCIQLYRRVRWGIFLSATLKFRIERELAPIFLTVGLKMFIVRELFYDKLFLRCWRIYVPYTVRDFEFTVRKSLSVSVPPSKQNLKLKLKILKFKIPQWMIRKFASIQSNRQNSNFMSLNFRDFVVEFLVKSLGYFCNKSIKIRK